MVLVQRVVHSLTHSGPACCTTCPAQGCQHSGAKTLIIYRGERANPVEVGNLQRSPGTPVERAAYPVPSAALLDPVSRPLTPRGMSARSCAAFGTSARLVPQTSLPKRASRKKAAPGPHALRLVPSLAAVLFLPSRSTVSGSGWSRTYYYCPPPSF